MPHHGGKISIRSYGNARPHKATAKTGAVKKAAAPKVAVVAELHARFNLVQRAPYLYQLQSH